MSKTAISKVTSKGQVTVPDAIRTLLRIQEGDRLEWIGTDTGVVMVRKTGGQLADLVGALGQPARSASLEAMDDGIRAHAARVARARR